MTTAYTTAPSQRTLFAILRLIARQIGSEDELLQTDIADTLHISRPTVRNAITYLKRHDLVEKLSLRRYALTDKGRTLIAAETTTATPPAAPNTRTVREPSSLRPPSKAELMAGRASYSRAIVGSEP